jgi:DNA-formamidopyrimidine glycosylase
MPEGVEVKIQAKELNERLSGRKLVEINILGGKYKESTQKEYSIFRKRLKALKSDMSNLNDSEQVKIDWVRNKGKYIYMQISIESENKKGVKFIGNHLGMTGNWRNNPTQHTLIEIIVQKNGRVDKVYLDDYRQLSKFGIFSAFEMKKNLNKLGMDILNEKFTLPVFEKILVSYSKSKRNIAVILADQSIISGIGNYLRADILYEAKINPLSKMMYLDENDIKTLYKSIIKVCKESLSKKGTVIKTYRHIDGSSISPPGKYNTLVYGKKTDPNGNKIEKIQIQNRTIYWVPSVQKLKRLISIKNGT